MYTRIVLTAQQKSDILSLAREIARGIAPIDVPLGTFSTGNTKLNELADLLGLPHARVGAFDVTAGKTCPFANICHGVAVELPNGKMTLQRSDGAEFDCYAVKIEARRKNVWLSHERNTEAVRKYCADKDPVGLAVWIIATLLRKSPKLENGGVVRWHASGDFFKATYVVAADIVAQVLTEVQFFGYSKSPWVVQFLSETENCKLVHSHGSKFDAQAEAMDIPQSYVRCHPEQYKDIPTACEVATDPNDFGYILRQESFAINLH